LLSPADEVMSEDSSPPPANKAMSEDVSPSPTNNNVSSFANNNVSSSANKRVSSSSADNGVSQASPTNHDGDDSKDTTDELMGDSQGPADDNSNNSQDATDDVMDDSQGPADDDNNNNSQGPANDDNDNSQDLADEVANNVLSETPPTTNQLIQRMLSSTRKTLLRTVQQRVHYEHQIYPAILSLLLDILPRNRGFLHHPQGLLRPVVDFDNNPDTELAPTQTTHEEINVNALSFSSTGATHVGCESGVQCFFLPCNSLTQVILHR